jgi:CheY-like chemotaxis protein
MDARERRAGWRVLTGGLASAPPPGARGAPGSAGASASRSDRTRHVAVIDDDPLGCQLVATVIGRLDPKRVVVHGFGGPDEALEAARHQRFDLVISDLHLGARQISGLTLIAQMRSQGIDGSALQAILVTADLEPRVTFEAARQQVPIVLEKSLDLHRLALRCCALLDLRPPA